MSAAVRLDMHDLLAMLDELRARIVDLDGTMINIEVRSKEVNSEKAEVNRKLLYAAHLAHLVEADIMSHYHRFKGEDPPYIATD